MLKYLSLIMLVVLALGLPMLMLGPDGKPVMTPSDWVPDTKPMRDLLQSVQMPELRDATQANTNAQTAKSGTYYRWQDANGRWQYSDTGAGTSAEQQALPEPVNRIPPPPSAQSEGQSQDVQRLMKVLEQRLGPMAQQ